jgi:chemotaxis response regulator CheB
MPQSAIASGCVDFVLPPDDIARDLVRIAQHPHAARRVATNLVWYSFGVR